MTTQSHHIKHVTAQSDTPFLIENVTNGNVSENRVWVDVEGDVSNLSISRYGLDIVQGPLNRAKFHKPRRLSLNKDIDLIYPEKRLFANKNPHNITSIDTSPDEELIIFGDDTGGLDVVSIRENGELRRSLAGHLVYTSIVKFFPSGQVAISAGSDMQIKIWSVIDGSNPRTLVGHRGPVSCLSMIGRGRNVISSSTDGKVILWECGSGQEVRSMDFKNKVTGLNVLPWNGASNHGNDLFEADNKALAIATTDTVKIIDINDFSCSHLNLSIPKSTQITCMASQDSLLALGTTSGQTYIYDIRNTSLPAWNLSKSSSYQSTIESLAFKSSTKLSILDQSTIQTISFKSNQDTTTAYYVHEFVPKTFTQTSEHIYTGGKNGVLNIY